MRLEGVKMNLTGGKRFSIWIKVLILVILILCMIQQLARITQIIGLITIHLYYETDLQFAITVIVVIIIPFRDFIIATSLMSLYWH